MCFFVPRTLFQRIIDDESTSEEVRQAARQQLDAITSTLAALNEAKSAQATVKTRYDEIPTGFPEFSSKIWGMATRNIEEIDYETGTVSGTSYQPLPGILYKTSQDPSHEDADVNSCMDALRTTYDFYKEVFGRNSIDGNGLQLEASIHYSTRYNNALWEGQSKQMIFGDGDGNNRFGRFAGFFKPGAFVNSLDVIAHELTHGVTQHTANFEYQGQPGALNESVSDVFGSMVEQWKNKQTVNQASWILGAGLLFQHSESILSGATDLRSMKDPSATSNYNPQPDHVAMALGGFSWLSAGKIWYATLTNERMKPKTIFEEFANVTVIQAKVLFPDGESVASVVTKAWKDVGVL